MAALVNGATGHAVPAAPAGLRRAGLGAWWPGDGGAGAREQGAEGVCVEQREGRIHRYKGHAVRKNVAQAYSMHATYSRSGPESDSWRQLFENARSARAVEHSDLVPFWVYTTEGGAHIERHLPMLPLSKDVDRADGLQKMTRR
jgi:hypothetical protein